MPSCAPPPLQPHCRTPQHQKKILLYPGVMSETAGEMINSLVGREGPLGELVQWADITAALYFLGHNVKIAFSLKELQSLIGASPGKGNYPVLVPLPFDLVYTDYHSLGHLHGNMGLFYGEYKCHFRIIDSFGTEPVFNHRNYANLHSFRPIWGSWNLQPQQYMTMFPHTPDNSFMGFVSEELYEAKKRETRAQKIQNLTGLCLCWHGPEVVHHYQPNSLSSNEIFQPPQRILSAGKTHCLLSANPSMRLRLNDGFACKPMAGTPGL
eukprot:gi/632952721/ref/XP_007892005.1/ PREDICTED: LOW QUALITY PROTEIN: alpha-1,6-mannosylglycoprotein 6-beta-N-acetylglucosaminyltransferase B-like [Callorhinchus milii]